MTGRRGVLPRQHDDQLRARGLRAERVRALGYTKSEVSHPLRKTIKLGKPQGPCGTLSYRGKLLPISRRQLASYAATTFVAPKRKR